MMLRFGSVIALLCGGLALTAAELRYELRGQIEPGPGTAVVVLSGASMPFTTQTNVGGDGRFRFRNLLPGPYKVYVYAPSAGEVEQTVEVGPGTADKKRRVELTIPFSSPDFSADVAAQRHSISARDLSIPNEAKHDFVEARRLLGRHDTPGAIARLLHAVEVAPQFAAAWNELGTTAYLSRRYADAEGYFRKALEVDPEEFGPLVNLGGVLLNLERPEEAYKYNSFAVSRKPKDALANVQLGMNYFMLGHYEAAMKYLTEAKSRDPSHFSHPQLYLAEIYALRGDKLQAIAELRDFVARHPDAPQVARVKLRIEQLQAP